MSLMMIKFENIALTIITTHRPLSDLCQLLLERLGGYIVNLCVFYFYNLIGKLTTFCNFRSSVCANKQWIIPLPPHGVLLTIVTESRQHPCQD
jgi:hypothetical protein